MKLSFGVEVSIFAVVGEIFTFSQFKLDNTSENNKIETNNSGMLLTSSLCSANPGSDYLADACFDFPPLDIETNLEETNNIEAFKYKKRNKKRRKGKAIVIHLNDSLHQCETNNN
jgi:hypothetical protein